VLTFRGVTNMSSPAENTHSKDVRLKRLSKACELTLQRYLAMATDTCNMAGRLRILPVSKDKRLELFLQKKKEDEAHDAYQKARNALLAAIEADPDLTYAQQDSPSMVRGNSRSGAYRRRSS
jgi:hypothetical protein